MRNAGIIGKNSAVNGTSLKGLGDLDDKFLNRIGTSFGLGYLYALSYVSSTGGTLTVYDGGSDISSTLDGYYGNTNGDALFLPPGSYVIDSSYSSNFKGNYSSAVFPGGYYGVFGGDPQTTIIEAITDASVSYTDNTILDWNEVGDNYTFDAGYLTLRFQSFGSLTLQYANAMFSGVGGTGDLIKAQFKNCAFNKNDSPHSMLYDNSGDTGYIWLKNCSLGNVSSLLTNYSGSKTNKDAFNCLFEPAITTTHWGTLTNCVTNGSYFTIEADHTMTYDTATYSTAGHLYGLNDTSWSAPV